MFPAQVRIYRELIMNNAYNEKHSLITMLLIDYYIFDIPDSVPLYCNRT